MEKECQSFIDAGKDVIEDYLQCLYHKSQNAGLNDAEFEELKTHIVYVSRIHEMLDRVYFIETGRFSSART